MRFAQPEFLQFLWLIPILIGLIVFATLRRRARVARFADLASFEQLVPDLSLTRRTAHDVLRLVAVVLLILALARPQFGQRLSVLKQQGIDVMVAIDTSASMLAIDAGPEASRLDAARRMVSALASELAGDRIGITVFAGQAYIQCPLTVDYKAARMLLAAVGSETVPQPGTAIGRAIDKSLLAFNEDGASRAIVLCTDGEDHDGEPLDAARRAKEAGVRVIAVGFGADRGEPIPVTNEAGQRVGYKRDRSGSLVVSRLDEATLGEIASITGGAYIRASGGSEIDELMAELEEIETREIEAGFHRHYDDRFHIFAVAACIVMLLARWLGERRGRLRQGVRVSVVGAGVFLVGALTHAPSLVAAPLEADVERGNSALAEGRAEAAVDHYLDAITKDPNRPEVHYNLGNALYSAGEFDQAVGAYVMAADADSSLQTALRYNLGGALYRQGQFAEAAEAYRQALRNDPGDDDAKWNLELALKRLAEQQQQQQQQDEDEQSDEQQQGEDGEPGEDGEQNEQSDESQGEDGEQGDEEQSESEDSEQSESEEEQSDGAQNDPTEGTENEQAPPEGQQQLEPAELPQGMSEEDAKRWLEALNDDELELLKERFRAKRRRTDVEKDW